MSAKLGAFRTETTEAVTAQASKRACELGMSLLRWNKEPPTMRAMMSPAEARPTSSATIEAAFAATPSTRPLTLVEEPNR